MRSATRKPLPVLVVGIALALAVAVVLWQTTSSKGQENPIPIMPQMTVVYETTGPSINAGGREVASREVRRLVYTSKTRWTDTVIEAPTVDLGRYGTGSRVGSYESLDGESTVSYNALTGLRDEGTHDGGTLVPNQALIYGTIPSVLLDGAPALTKSEVTSEATVCKDGTCVDNVTAVQYRGATGQADLVIYRTAAWSVPLKLGSLYEAKKIEIQTEE